MSALTAQRVRAEVAAPPVAPRQAVVLACHRGHSHRRVAALLGLPERAAKSRPRPALRRVATALRRVATALRRVATALRKLDGVRS